MLHKKLVMILIAAGFLRFYNLMWDAPYFFNPDERNMASAITKLSFPKDMNPKFFAYGQFPLYLAYFSARTAHVSFPQAIFWLRFWSALASTLTVFIVYLITKKLVPTLLVAFIPGLIQSAHFGTTESLLTFFFILIIYLSILLLSKKLSASRFTLYASLTLGLAISTKVSALVFVAIPFLAIFLSKLKLLKKFLFLFLILTSSFLILCLTSPYNLLDLKSFRGAMNYESSVALGQYRAFYTRQYENTIPILFQLEKIFPYALGLPIFILGILGIGICLGQLVIRSIRNSLSAHDKIIFLVLTAFFIYFLPNAFLYAKWTRFMSPILPLFSIFASYFIIRISTRLKRFKFLILVLIFAFCVLSFISGLAFFSIYLRPDTRVQASKWIYQNIPSGSYVLSETANVIDIPLTLNAKPYTLNPISFNFYELDENPSRFEELINHLEKADYIFIPSRRIFKNHLRFPEKYPLTNRYYELLFSGRLGFEKVAEFSALPDENAEETFTVFDHPVIRIYKKVQNNNNQEYQNLFQIL